MAKKQICLSNLELSMIWMSCGYCIRKNTISASLHAASILKEYYYKLTDTQKVEISKRVQKELFGKNVQNEQVWLDFTNCLDVNSHEFCKVINNETGEIIKTEYFWSQKKVAWNSDEVVKVRKSVSDYVKNPLSVNIINNEDIYVEGDEVKPLKQKQKKPKNIDINLLDEI